jgi:hypothetical protein
MAKDLNYIFEKRESAEDVAPDSVGTFNSYFIRIKGSNLKEIPFYFVNEQDPSRLHSCQKGTDFRS